MTNPHEPTYSLPTYERAGWYRHTVEPRVTYNERDHRDGGHSGTIVTPTLSAPVEADQRRDLVDTIRKACPGIGAVRGLAAVRYLSALRSLPETVAAREAVALIPSDGTVPDHASAPDGWEARKHETVQKRTRKGRLVVERKRVGIAPVSGDVDAIGWNGCDDALSDRASLARMLATAELRADHVADDHGHTLYGARRLGSGARVSFDVQRVADRHYGPADGVPRLIGSDVTDWHEMREAPSGIDPRIGSYVTESHAGLSGWIHDSTLDSLASPESVYGTHTHSLKRAEPRTAPGATKVDGRTVEVFALKRGRKRENDPTATRLFVVALDGETTVTNALIGLTDEPVTRGEIDHNVTRSPRVVAPRHANRTQPARRFVVRQSLTHAPRSNASMEAEARHGRPTIAQPDARYVGHTLVNRPRTNEKGVKRAEARERANVKREARTIGTVNAVDLEHRGVAELLSNVNRGERVVLKLESGQRAVTRSTAGLYATQYTRPDGKRATYRTRSAEAMASFVA